MDDVFYCRWTIYLGRSIDDRSNSAISEKEKWRIRFASFPDTVDKLFCGDFHILGSNTTRDINGSFIDRFIFGDVSAFDNWVEACAMEIVKTP